MTWRSRPPSQHANTKKGGAHTPFWALVLTAFVCFALGLTAGLTLFADDEEIADPRGERTADRRQQLIDEAHGHLIALSQLDAATNVVGAPTRFGLVVLGKEERDVCVTGQHGFKVHDWYDSACGIQVTWYLAAKRGSTATVEAAANARFKGRRVPTVESFAWNDESGPLPSELSGEVDARRAGSAGQLHALQRAAQIDFPEQDAVYHDALTTFDLASAYTSRGKGRNVVARLSLVAQYTWT